MAELPVPVSNVLRRPAPSELDLTWQRIASSRDKKRRRWMLPIALAAGAATAACAVLLLGRDPGPLHLASGAPISQLATESGTRLPLSDGSQLLLRSQTQLLPLANSGTTFRCELLGGEVTFDVVPGGPRRWTVQAGLADVEVVGTRFTVTRSSTALSVEVERGAVRVRENTGRRGEHFLVTGQKLTLREASATTSSPPSPGPEQHERSSQEVLGPARYPLHVPAPQRPSRVPASSGASPSERKREEDGVRWQEVMASSGAKAAFDLLGEAGFDDRVASSRDVEELLLLADTARSAGRPRSALAPLERILNRHPDHPSAALAAFTLGKVRLDALADPGGAAVAFDQALGLGVPHALKEEAWVRLVEARLRSGDRRGAERAAAEHRLHFPTSSWCKTIERWLETNDRIPAGLRDPSVVPASPQP